MYWIYFIVVTVPEVINGNGSFLFEDDRESLLIFFVGAIGLFIYLWKENQLQFYVREKTRIQKETFRVSRDLADSYSYIAEINRKMDILKNIALGLPETSAVTPERMEELYADILEALALLGKTKSFFLCIVDVRIGKILKMLDMRGQNCPDIDFSALAKRGENVIREGDYIIVRSPRRTRGCLAFILFRKKNGIIEDAEIFKALASQALFLYSREVEEKEKHKNKNDSV